MNKVHVEEVIVIAGNKHLHNLTQCYSDVVQMCEPSTGQAQYFISGTAWRSFYYTGMNCITYEFYRAQINYTLAYQICLLFEFFVAVINNLMPI